MLTKDSTVERKIALTSPSGLTLYAAQNANAIAPHGPTLTNNAPSKS